MDNRRSQSVNHLPPSLGPLITALLRTGPQPERPKSSAAGPGRPHEIPVFERYQASIPLDIHQCSVLKKFFDKTLGHIFSCTGAESGELLMYFTNQPQIRRAANGYVCDIALARVR